MISNFINLSSYCVLEFRATPLGEANPPILTSQFYLVDNKHLGINQIYNTDGYSTQTRNTRDFSLIGLGGSKLIYNDITLIPMYSDFDPLITETTVSSELSSNMVMDTMRFHFASGFNFTEVEHVIVGARHKLNNITQIQLANIILNAVTTASLFSYNTRPLFLANTIYDKYIDIKIPSIPWLDADFKEFGASSFEHAITGGIGFIKNAPITVFLAEATRSNYYASNNITYDQYQITQYYEGSVSQINKFDTLGCHIEEAEDGDYIEFFATWNGAFPDSLISTLNESGADQQWIISHQLTIYEHIGSDVVLSGNSLIYQETNFDTPLTYRPILKQAGFAVAMSIDYIMRLINKKNGDQIIKSASMSIINPNRYGKKLEKIELLNGPQSMRIYNKIEQKNFESNAIFSGAQTVNTATLTAANLNAENNSLRAQLAIASGAQTSPIVKQANIHLSSGNALSTNTDEVTYGQGRAILVIDPVDNLIRLTLYQKQILSPTVTNFPRLNLVTGFFGVIFKLTFGTTNDFIFSNTSFGAISNLVNGELLFRIPKIQAKLLLANAKNSFMLTKVDPTLIETLMYAGTWLSSSDYQAANSAIDIARENATTAAALTTALATINTLTTQKAAALLARDAANAAKDEEFRLKNLAITALSNHMASHSSGTSGTQGTASTAGTQGTAGSAGAVATVAPSINTTSVSGGGAGYQFGISGNFPATITGVSFGLTTYVGSTGAQFARINQNLINANVPPNMTSGDYNIYVANAAGVGTSPQKFQVVGIAPPTIIVNWRVYVGALSLGNYADWFPPAALSPPGSYDSLSLVFDIGNGAEVQPLILGPIASINAHSSTFANGYISGNFNVTPVNGQIKFRLIRGLSSGANTNVGHRNQVKLDGVTIHYQNRNGSAPEYNNYFNGWTYNTGNTAYTVQQAGGWMIFTVGQLFNGAQPRVLNIESVTMSG